MKSSTLIFIFLNVLFISCQNLRNLMLSMDPKKLKTLTNIASNTLFQLFGVSIDFNGRGYGIIDNSKLKIEIALYDDQEIPTEESKFRFEIINWSPQIPEIKVDEAILDIFGKSYDVKEQYKILANLFANAIENGFVISYNKTGDDIVANSRFKCFVNTEDGNGSFEIAIEDKNDKTTILDSIEKFLKDIKLDEIAYILELCARASSVFLGIKKDWFSSSSFLNIPYLVILLIFGLL